MRRRARAEIVLAQDNRSGGLSYWQAGGQQSRTGRDGISLADYIHALFGLIRQKDARRVLMIGCGGGTLATMLARVGVRAVVVDSDPISFQVARDYFHMPPEMECHKADGAGYLRRHPARYDAIVLDAFAGETIPRHFRKPEFFLLAKARLRPGGIFLVNIVVGDDDDDAAETIVETMRAAWRNVRLLDRPGIGNGSRNAIAAAGAVKDLTKPRLLLKPASSARTLARKLAGYRFAD